jgi:hypothetical protein
MKATLEKLTKKSTRPQTPFDALKGPPTSYPLRPRCQEVVLAAERSEAEQLIADYRVAEQLALDNNIALKAALIEPANLYAYRGAVQIEQVRREIAKMDHQQFMVAESQMQELRVTA